MMLQSVGPRRRRHARHHPALVRKADGPSRAARPDNPARAFPPRARQRTAGGGDALQVAVEQRDVHLQAIMQAVDGLLLRHGALIGRRQQRRHHLAGEFEGFIRRRRLGREAPHDAAEQHDQHEAGNDRHVDLTVETAHGGQSCALANT